MRTGVGVFAPGTPLASDASIEVVTAPHNLQHARQAIRDSGYGGQRVAFMIPTDSAPLLAFGNVIYQRLKDAGLNIDYQAMDWGTLVSRRNQVDNGSWNTYITVNPGQYSTPATHYFLVSAYHQDRTMATLRDAWYDAPDLAAEKRAADQIQRRYFENPPTLPLGQYYSPAAYRVSLTDLVPAPWAIFWNAKKS